MAAVGGEGYSPEKEGSMNSGRWIVLNSAASAEEGERLAKRKWTTPAGDRDRTSSSSSCFLRMARIWLAERQICVTRLAFSGLSLRVPKEGEREEGRKQAQEGKEPLAQALAI